MGDRWLDIVGVGEEDACGLSGAARAALAAAEVVFGGPRHLARVDAGPRGRAWSVPFDVQPVLALRGRRVVVLASGDPFWFGAGGTLAAHLDPSEWQAHPTASTFSLAAARLGWRLEATVCLGLHATAFASALTRLHPGARLICLMRSGAAVGEFAQWLQAQGFGASTLHVMEALGGARERVRTVVADGFDLNDVAAPVAVAVEARGAAGLPHTPGLPDAHFAHDGQITKSPVRAVTLSALAPRPGEHLWDLGAGSGSVSVEWCLAGGRATAVEQHADRVAHIRANAQRFGLDKALEVVEGTAVAACERLATPQAVFVGGGFDAALFARLQVQARGARLVVNAVTLETEALLIALHGTHGGELLRLELSHVAPLGRLRGWVPARPVVQWRGAL